MEQLVIWQKDGTNEMIMKVIIIIIIIIIIPALSYLVDSAQSDPTATAYLAGPQPTCWKATGRGLFSLSI